MPGRRSSIHVDPAVEDEEMFTEELIARNQDFRRGRPPRPWPEAGAFPLAVVSCYDPRLDELLRPALGLGAGEGFLIRTAGAAVSEDVLRSLAVAVYLFEVRNVLVVGHRRCRMASFPTAEFIEAFRGRGVDRRAFGTTDLRTWAGAVASPRAGVLASVGTIAAAPFLPTDLSLAGAVLDEESGELELVFTPGDTPPAARATVPESAPGGAAEAMLEELREEREEARPPEHAAPASVPPPPPPAEAPAEQHPALARIRRTLDELAEKQGFRRELGSLRRALEKEPSTLRQLVLILQFLKGAAADGHEVREAIEKLSREISSSRKQIARQVLIDLVSPRRKRKGKG